MYKEGSTKGIFAIIGALLLVVAYCYPHEVTFLAKLVWDVIVINVRPVLQSIADSFHGSHTP
jgi:hypothetical protein